MPSVKTHPQREKGYKIRASLMILPYTHYGLQSLEVHLGTMPSQTDRPLFNLQRSAPVSLVFITYSFLHFLHSPFHGLQNIYFFCNVCCPAELRAPERKTISIFQFTCYLQHLSHCQAHDRQSNDIHLINRNINGYITYGPYKLESEQYNKDICNS